MRCNMYVGDFNAYGVDAIKGHLDPEEDIDFPPRTGDTRLPTVPPPRSRFPPEQPRTAAWHHQSWLGPKFSRP